MCQHDQRPRSGRLESGVVHPINIIYVLVHHQRVPEDANGVRPDWLPIEDDPLKGLDRTIMPYIPRTTYDTLVTAAPEDLQPRISQKKTRPKREPAHAPGAESPRAWGMEPYERAFRYRG